MQYTAPCFLIASIAAAPRSLLPTMPMRPVFAQHGSTNLSMRELVVGPAGPPPRRAPRPRAGVVDEAVGEVHRQLLAARHHVDHALVRGVAAGEELAGEQQRLARLPVAISAL
jgi:hypothetical protein